MADKNEGGAAGASLSEDQLKSLFSEMVRYRRFEEAAARAYGTGKIYGFCHLHIGQEAISAAVGEAARDSDLVISAYRIHTMALARGVSEEEAMFELFGRDTGNVRGLGGSMHLFNPEQGFYGGWGLVGQQVPVGTGLAFAQKYNGTDNVVVCLLGDGAVHQGAVHESLNLASIWDLPIVYIVENNHYGMGTAVERISALPPLHRIGESYNIEHSEFDGMDVLKSYDAVSEAVEHARSESRPVFLEGKCSRFKGHSMSDPAKYRTREELEEEKSRDPIPHLRQHLIDNGILTEDEVDQIDKDAKKKMKEVAKQAEDEPWPDPSILDDYVFA
jgi:pyruvate dehydrogenase E1 component alpha subunit